MVQDPSQEKYKGPGKVTSSILPAIGYGLLGTLVAGIPHMISNMRGVPVAGWQKTLSWAGLIGGGLFGVMRGYNKASKAETDFYRQQTETKVLQAENDILKARTDWADRTGKAPSELNIPQPGAAGSMADKIMAERVEQEGQEQGIS